METRDFFRTCFHLDNEKLLADLDSISRLTAVKKGEVVTREGEAPQELLILVEGVFRGFFSDGKGEEITECFAYKPGSPVMACTDLGQVSSISLVALSDSLCYALPIQEVCALIAVHPELLNLSNALLLESLQYHWKVKSLLYKYTAKQRYQWFCETHPGLLELAGAKYVASFLNMTPVTLSRLRRELKRKDR